MAKILERNLERRKKRFSVLHVDWCLSDDCSDYRVLGRSLRHILHLLQDVITRNYDRKSSRRFYWEILRYMMWIIASSFFAINFLCKHFISIIDFSQKKLLYIFGSIFGIVFSDGPSFGEIFMRKVIEIPIFSSPFPYNIWKNMSSYYLFMTYSSYKSEKPGNPVVNVAQKRDIINLLKIIFGNPFKLKISKNLYKNMDFSWNFLTPLFWVDFNLIANKILKLVQWN